MQLRFPLLDGVHTWGSNNSLVVDNLLFTPRFRVRSMRIVIWILLITLRSSNVTAVKVEALQPVVKTPMLMATTMLMADDYSIMNSFFTGPQ